MRMVALVMVVLLGGCVVRNAEPPYLQIKDMATTDLPCDGDIRVDQISDRGYCAYGCGSSRHYVCSATTGDCDAAWPDWCP